MRSEPLPAGPPRPLKERLIEGGTDFGLQLWAFLREGIRDFKGRDRYFKYKALILGLYVVMTVTTLGVACPGPSTSTTSIGARVVVGGARDRPVWLIKNESDTDWKDVTVIINDKYRAAVGVVRAQQDLAVTPLQLIGDQGRAVPGDLRATRLEVRTDDGNAVLIDEGKVHE